MCPKLLFTTWLPFVLLVLPLRAQADGGLPTQPYLYVEGKAEVEKAADLVTLRFDLSSRQQEQPAANNLVQEQSAKVFALLKAMKVADSDVVASTLSSEAEYEANENSPRSRGVLIGYRVTRPFVVKVRDLIAFPKLVDELLALRVEEFSGIEEGLSKPKEAEDDVWAKALANARERAEKTLKAAEMKADSVFAISPVAFPEIQRRIFGGSAEGAVAYKSTAAEKVKASEYRLAPVTVSQSVHVIYLISPAKTDQRLR